MAASEVRAGKAFVEVGVKDQYSASLLKLEGKLKSLGDSASAVGRNIALVGAGIGASLLAAAKVYAEVGDQIAKASTRTGIAADALSELSYAASQSGTDLETLEKGFNKLAKIVVEAAHGSDTAKASLASIGLTVDQLINLKPDEQFKLIADSISHIENPTQRAAAALEIFGKSGTQLVPLMQDGAKGIDDLQAAARRLGLSISTQDAKAAEEFGDRLDDLGKVAVSTAVQLGAAIAPALRSYIVQMTDSVSATIAFIRANREVITSYVETGLEIAKYALIIGTAIYATGKLISITAGVIGVVGSIGKAITAVKALSSATTAAAALTAANPIGVVVVGIAALFAAKYAMDQYSIAAERVATLKLENHAAEKIAEDAKKARDETQSLINTLAGLNNKSRLTPDDASTANDTIAALTKQYGNLGISIDASTGKLSGFIEGYKRLNAIETNREIDVQTRVAKEQTGNASAIGKRISTSTYDGTGYLDALAEQKKAQDKAVAAFARIKELRDQLAKNGESAVLDDAKGTKGNTAGSPEDVADAQKHSDDLAKARERLDKITQDQQRGALSSSDKQIAEVNDKYKEQYELLKQLYAEAQKQGRPGEQLKIVQEANAAYKQRQVDIDKINKEAKDKKDKEDKAATDQVKRDAEEAKKIEQDKVIFALKLREELAEKTGDKTAVDALKKQISSAEFEKTLDGIFGTDGKDADGRNRARAIYDQTQNQPEKINGKSQGTFDLATAGQALQSGGVWDQMLQTQKNIEKNTKKTANSDDVLYQ